MNKKRLAAMILLCIGLMPGCLSAPRTAANPNPPPMIGTRNIVAPPPEDYQQYRAQKFDPYPSIDIGGTSMAGTRPQGAQDPAAPVLRAQPRIPDSVGY
jgi:hypothetical protein